MEQPQSALAAPEGARELFGTRWPLAAAYVRRLVGPGVERGLIGPRERDRVWERHVLNCAVLGELVPVGARVGDVGSGAGLPGIVLAILREDLHVDLIEPMQRRVTFLRESVAELGLSGCRVVRARAEQLAGQASYDVVTARAVAPLDRLLAGTMPLLSPGGSLLALKGATAEQELAALPRELLAGGSARMVVLSSVTGEATRVVVITAADPASAVPAGPASPGPASEREPSTSAAARPR